jgi:deoxyribonuclease-4
MIFFGASGIGGRDEAERNLESFSKAGIKAAEVAFTYSIYLKKDDAIRIGKKAKELGISLSIHAPYYINLNSKEKGKREASKKRILDCCEIGSYLGARKVVFHGGYYIKDTEIHRISVSKNSKKNKQEFSDDEEGKEEAFQVIKKEVLEMMAEIKKHNWKIEIAPEIMGRRNVFGSIDEISRLSKETGCSFCIDFAHVLARYGESKFDELRKAFPKEKWHCHFSGIIFGDKGEKKHRDTRKEEWKELLKNLPKDKEITLICEAPNPFRDVVEGMSLWKD